MKIVNAKCNNCGQELSFDAEKTMLFCPYCGSKQLIIDGDEVKVAKEKYEAYRDIELARTETERERNRQEHERETELIKRGDSVIIEKERLKTEKRAAIEKSRLERKIMKLQYKQEKEQSLTEKDKDNRVFLRVMLGFAVFILICFATSWWLSYVYVHTPESSKNCIGKGYAIIQQQFKDAGFKSVHSEVVEDLSDGWIFKDTDKVGTVKQVSVNGEFNFKKGQSYSRFSPVIVYYHEYPTSSGK